MRPKSIPESLEIDFGRPRGRSMSTSTAFGRCFEECDFLMIFEVCKNRPKMTKVRHLGGKNEKHAPILGGSAAEAVDLGKVFRAVLQVLGQVLQNNLTRLAPPSKDGVGGLKGSALLADPRIQHEKIHQIKM